MPSYVRLKKPTSDDSLTVQLALMQDQLKQVLTNQNTGAAKSAAPVNDGDEGPCTYRYFHIPKQMENGKWKMVIHFSFSIF